MSQKPIAIIGSIDPNRPNYNPGLKNIHAAADAARALGNELASAKYRILVFSSNPTFVEAYIVEGYVKSGKALPKSIIMLYPMNRDPNIHGEFAEQKSNPDLFDLRIDPHPSWEVSYYQSLPDVKGVLIIGGGNATLIIGLMALANRVPVVSIACFGGKAEEIWAIARNKSWIDNDDWTEMGRGAWAPSMSEILVKSFDRQKTNLEKLDQSQANADLQIQKDRESRSLYAISSGILAAILTTVGLFGLDSFEDYKVWLYAICFIVIPISAGIAGSMFFTLRQRRGSANIVRPPSIKETVAHGLWAGFGSAILFFASQVTANPAIKGLNKAVITDTSGLNILLLFILMIGFVAGLTYEAVFSKWEVVDASRSAMIEKGAP